MQLRLNELKGRLNDGKSELVPISYIPGNPCIFGSIFVDVMKRVGEVLSKRSRLVVQNYADMGTSSIATKAPTVQRFSKRLSFSLTFPLGKMTPFTRDITQSYFQSSTCLKRDVLMKVRKELGLQDDRVLRVLNPLYGIPD